MIFHLFPFRNFNSFGYKPSIGHDENKKLKTLKAWNADGMDQADNLR